MCGCHTAPSSRLGAGRPPCSHDINSVGHVCWGLGIPRCNSTQTAACPLEDGGCRDLSRPHFRVEAPSGDEPAVGAAGGRGPRPRPLAAIALEQGPSCSTCAGSCILFTLRPSSIVVVPQPGHREPRGLALASGDVSPSVSEASARDARGSPWPRAGTNVPWRPGLARRAWLQAGRGGGGAPSRPRGHGTAYFPVMSSSAAAGSNASARALLPRLWAPCASPSAHERALVPKDRLCLLVR